MDFRGVALGFTIGLIVAGLVGFILYSQLSDMGTALAKMRSSLEECNTALSAAKANASMLADQLKACTREKASLSKELRGLQAKYEELMVNYTRLTTRYNRLVADYEVLRERLADVMKRYRELQVSYNELTRVKQELEQSLSQLKTLYDELQRRYQETLNAKEELEIQLNTLQREYNSVVSELKDLKQRYTSLSSEYNELYSSYKELLDKYNSLVSDYNELKSEHDRLVNALHRAYAWLGFYETGNRTGYLKAFYTKLLALAVESAKPLAGLVGFRHSDIGWRSFEVFNFTLSYLSYCYDSYVRYVNTSDGRVMVWDNAWQLPNETWTNGCGDCEDLALFAYALLNLTAPPSVKLYLVEFKPAKWNVSHVGLLLVDLKSKRYYIVDPAGNYHNGVQVYLMLRVRAADGTELLYYISPLDVSRYEKKRLYNYSVAEIVYYDVFEDRDYTGEDLTVYYYKDLLAALRDWIVRYWDAYPLDYVAVIGPGIYEEFKTLADAAQWIAQHEHS